MKKITTMLLVVAMMISLVACGSGKAGEQSTGETPLEILVNVWDSYMDDEKFSIEGWEFPVKMHLDAMVSDLDRTLYKVICNIRLLYTYYSEDLENELHYALERFEAHCLFEV